MQVFEIVFMHSASILLLDLDFLFQWGGERYEEVQQTKVWCEVLSGIHCYGERRFLKDGFPCIKLVLHFCVCVFNMLLLHSYTPANRVLGYSIFHMVGWLICCEV